MHIGPVKFGCNKIHPGKWQHLAVQVIDASGKKEDVTKLKTLNSDVLNIWPTQDKWINKEVMDKFEANMKAAGKKLTVKAYDADHAFANPSNPKFKEEFTADAYKNTLDFFKARLK